MYLEPWSAARLACERAGSFVCSWVCWLFKMKTFSILLFWTILALKIYIAVCHLPEDISARSWAFQAQLSGEEVVCCCFVLFFSCRAIPERNWEGTRNWGTAAPWSLPASHSGLQRRQEWTQGHHQSPHCTEHTGALAMSVKAGPQTIFIYGLFSEHTYDFITPLGDCALAAKTKYCPGKTLMWLTKLKYFSRFKSLE